MKMLTICLKPWQFVLFFSQWLGRCYLNIIKYHLLLMVSVDSLYDGYHQFNPCVMLLLFGKWYYVSIRLLLMSVKLVIDNSHVKDRSDTYHITIKSDVIPSYHHTTIHSNIIQQSCIDIFFIHFRDTYTTNIHVHTLLYSLCHNVHFNRSTKTPLH